MSEHSLVKYDTMCRAIAEAHKVDEVKDIRDKILMLELYHRQAGNYDAEKQAAEIRIQAEYKAGTLLAKMDKAFGARGNPGGQGAKLVPSPDGSAQATLDSLGITYKQSADWQKLAKIPKREFERSLKEHPRPTTAAIIRQHTDPPYQHVPDDALWVWGRLNDFERHGYLEMDPADIVAKLNDRMKDEVHELAPKVAAWLARIGKVAR